MLNLPLPGMECRSAAGNRGWDDLWNPISWGGWRHWLGGATEPEHCFQSGGAGIGGIKVLQLEVKAKCSGTAESDSAAGRVDMIDGKHLPLLVDHH